MKKLVVNSNYIICNRCGLTLNITNNKNIVNLSFFKSYSEDNKNTGYLHNCKTCCNKQYKNYYTKHIDHGHVLYLMCRLYNYPYHSVVAEGCVEDYITDNISTSRRIDNPFTYYLVKMVNILKKENNEFMDFTHYDTEFDKDISIKTIENEELNETLVDKWGSVFTNTELEFLEKKYNKLAENIIVDEGISSLIMQVCYTSLDQRKIIESQNTLENHKRLTELNKTIRDSLKDLGMDAKSKVERDNGKLVNSLGMSIAEYEEYDAIDILGKLKTLEDVNNIGGYIKDYFLRPALNNIKDDKNFKLEFTQEDESFEYLDMKDNKQ